MHRVSTSGPLQRSTRTTTDSTLTSSVKLYVSMFLCIRIYPFNTPTQQNYLPLFLLSFIRLALSLHRGSIHLSFRSFRKMLYNAIVQLLNVLSYYTIISQ